MMQLKFANDRIVVLNNIIKTDSCEIELLKNINADLQKRNEKHIKHKNILCGVSLAAIVAAVIGFLR